VFYLFLFKQNMSESLEDQLQSDLEDRLQFAREGRSQFITKVKDLEAQMLKLLGDSAKIVDGRWASIAKTHFQEGTMAALRAVSEKSQ
jgi:uncharacterized protein YacL